MISIRMRDHYRLTRVRDSSHSNLQTAYIIFTKWLCLRYNAKDRWRHVSNGRNANSWEILWDINTFGIWIREVYIISKFFMIFYKYMIFYCRKISLHKNVFLIISIKYYRNHHGVYRQFYISSFESTSKQYPDNASSLVLT